MNPHDPVTRRDALKTLGAGAAALSLGAMSVHAADSSAKKDAQPVLTLPKLGYTYDALEPHIDARTMEIHHTKHHQAYINNANTAIASQPALQKMSPEMMLSHLEAVPDAVRTAIRNNVGGHVNHAFFWQVIGPNAGGTPGGHVAEVINGAFGSFNAFKTQFADAATKRFGSGWAWLVVQKDGRLAVTSTANQDSPISEGATPILGLDVWEHAYYLKYQNLRADYIKAFWNVVSWEQVSRNLSAARGSRG
jgi:Fe-Mn family superoxide dismutase